MKTAVLLARPEPAMLPPVPLLGDPGVLVQAKSALGAGGGGGMVAPPISDAGRPLDAGTRSSMESGFGQDFGHIRVHDDARAHDNARGLNARAYAAGDHIVFGEGHYRPATALGQALIAHELAHSVQQGGVQMKADGPLPAAADAELEAQADRAAAAVTAGRSAPALSRVGVPAVFRATGDEAPPGGSTAAPLAGPQPIPPDFKLIGPTADVDNPMSATFSVSNFSLPEVKGPGPWVKEAYDLHANGNRLAFMPVFSGENREPSETMGAFKEGDEKYKNIWMAKFGFTSLRDIATGFESAAKTDPTVAALLTHEKAGPIIAGFKKKNTLTEAKCDIDHIVEKQLQGSSQPSNLQLLGSVKNQTSGTNTFSGLKKLVRKLDGTRYAKVNDLRLQFPAMAIKTDGESDDGSFLVEKALRDGKVKGSDKIAATMKGKPVALSAGSAPEVVDILPTGETQLDIDSKRLIPGMKLKTYTRSKTGGDDTIAAVLDHKVMKATGEKNEFFTLLSQKPPAPAPAAASVPAPGAAPDATATAAAPAAPAAEQRLVAMKKLSKGQRIGFYYPYLSRGEVTDVLVDAAGKMSGTGVIYPTPKFLGDLKIKFGPDTLTLDQELNVDALNNSRLISPYKNIFRFTESTAKLDLLNFRPEGEAKFSFGRVADPWMTGAVTLKVENSTFVATGNLALGKIPGIKEATGTVSYSTATGLAGELAATSSTFGGGTTTVSAKLGFKEVSGRLTPFANGNIVTQVKGASLTLGAAWGEQGIEYKVAGTIANPLPMVNSITLDGFYRRGKLSVTGKTKLDWKKFGTLDLTLTYTHVEGEEEGHFSGKGVSKATIGKAELDVEIGFAEDASWWAGGEIAYPITPEIKPKLKIQRAPNGRIKMSGEVTIAPIELTGKWPSPEGGKINFIKGVGAQFNVPTPVPGVTVFAELTASAGFEYGVGPVMLKDIKFSGSLYPFEEDPQVDATLTITPSVPAYAGVYGKFGANLGVQLAAGALGAKGGISLEPAIRLAGDVSTPFTATYKDKALSFDLAAKAKAGLNLTLDINLNAEVFALYGVFTHVWTHKLAAYKWDLGGEITLTMGKLSYNQAGLTLPKLSDVKVEPEIDPMAFIGKFLDDNKDQKRETTAAEKARYDRITSPYYKPPGGF